MSIEKTQQTSPTQTQLPQANNPPMGTVTSSFLVSMDTIFQSANVPGYDNFVQLLWFTSSEERISIGNMTSDFLPSATLVHSLLEMHIMTDSSMPTLRQNMRDNTPINTIQIARVGHLGNGATNWTLYSSLFYTCYLEAIEEFPDKLIVKARVNSRSDTAASTGFDGKQQPAAYNTYSGWDYTTNSAIA